jgi:Domain of unknown function (DUF4136)
LLVLQLAGCAGVRLVDSDVTAFSTLPASPAASSSSPAATSLPASASGTRTISATSATFSATYRFERLPSQQTDAARQDRLEALAQSALDKVGLVRVGDAPGSPKARFTLQMGISVLRGSRPYWDDFGVGLGAPFGPPFGSHLGGYVTVGVGSPGYYGGHYSAFPGAFGGSLLYLPPPYYVREVSLVLREASSGAVVFESRAKHEGPWHDSLAILPAMFDAALQGFPQPPAGLRRVVVEIAR